MIQNLREYGYGMTLNSAYGFWCGWLSGSAILAGAKLTLITNPEVRVSELLGHIGTPSFRRELAVGLAVYLCVKAIFSAIVDEPDTFSWRILLPDVAGIALGSLAASKLTHRVYHYVLYPMCVLTIAIIAYEIFKQDDTDI